MNASSRRFILPANQASANLCLVRPDGDAHGMASFQAASRTATASHPTWRAMASRHAESRRRHDDQARASDEDGRIASKVQSYLVRRSPKVPRLSTAMPPGWELLDGVDGLHGSAHSLVGQSGADDAPGWDGEDGGEAANHTIQPRHASQPAPADGTGSSISVLHTCVVARIRLTAGKLSIKVALEACSSPAGGLREHA
ncbi:hypothetical protein JDV02_010623 [Purpureocillium takamizusanense]|uniref:Uncharacterized protein n=1 Tax=Purpureocillium takamizusanense TaxID=2060973 RepID=A0A9Q8VHG1_9HYPO|nr:uncharacterized protein JDV02_010623 [Purpureocillium takamizusanense]UNI24904.1 hypothetical protein JDV02_010623 [Purpureocillium takamizusanense]